jgi:hypothetical protein
MFHFTIRDLLWLTAVAAVALGVAVYNRQPRRAAKPVGRYQIIEDSKHGYIYLLDTATGEIWQRYQGSWSNDRSPAMKE